MIAKSLLVVCIVHAIGFAQVDDEMDDPPDYGMVDRNKWRWEEDQQFFPFGRIETVPNVLGELNFTVSKDGRDVHAWKGHRYTVGDIRTVGEIRGNRLYYADQSLTKPGGQMVAVNLVTGKEIWRTDLEALGESNDVQGYQNRLNLDINDRRIIITGKESSGRYIEVKNIKTGETVAHRTYGEDEVETADENPFPFDEHAAAGKPDYEKPISEWSWHWERYVGLLSCMAETNSRFKVRFERCQDGKQFMTVFDGERAVGPWKVQETNLFRIVEDRLYIAFWDWQSLGSEIVAIDLETGKEVWRQKTKALNAKDRGGRYGNQLNLDV
ncbi:MAG: hypothetical protein ABL888_21645, partial [Pirellulaceae bacterium]